ncbi:MAG: hypothetical protein GY909_03240 [Oligoflexia bacterium]|nr:hypothetical protein [Oligoflexia bacterium]
MSFLFSFEVLSQPVELGLFSGTKTTAGSNNTNLNQATAYSMKWDFSNVDTTYFEHSTSSFSHQVKIKTAGDYKLSFNAPITLVDTNNSRRSLRAEVFVNGVVVPYARTESTYIRSNSGHQKSSASLVTYLSALSVNDVVEVRVQQATNAGTITTPAATMLMEYIPGTRKVFSASGTQTTNGTDVNTATPFAIQWSERQNISSAFSHSTSTNSHEITINETGQYLVYVNLPHTRSGACNGNNDRISVQARVELDGVLQDGAVGTQGYIRCMDNHLSSSSHWFGRLSMTAGQILTVDTLGETTNTGSAVIIPTGRKANIVVEKLDNTTDMIALSATTTTAGANWNGSGDIQWTSEAFKDATTFGHSTASNSHQITLNETGDYMVTYSNYFGSTVARTNPSIQLRINGSTQDGGECNTNYIRTSNGHNESSCTMSYLLKGVNAGEVLTISTGADGATGQVDDLGSTQVVIKKITSEDLPFAIENIPNRVLHLDAQDFGNILDESGRTASDPSFSGNVQTWKDKSSSTNANNGTQTTAADRPTLDLANKFMQFNGVTQHFNVANHAELNLGTLTERTIVLAFKTGADVTSPQVIYEEGGGIRGMNTYVRGGNLYLGIWNDRDDGDGIQPFTSASTPVAANTHYYVTLVYDYSNYTGPTGPDGQLRGHINGVSFASLGTTTSRLFPHSGAIGLGRKENGTFYDTGASGGTGDEFNGEIFEIIIYNSAIDSVEAIEFYNYMTQRWPDPQPVTNLALASNYTSDGTQTPNLIWTASSSPDVNDYQLSLGTSAGAIDVVGWTSVGNVTTANLTGLSLTECTDYYANVRAADSDPNYSTLESTEFIRYDATSPSDPSSLVVSGSSSVTASKVLTWASSVDACGFSHYELGIGTSAGADDVVSFTNIGNVLTYQFTGIAPNLVNATNYYFTLRGYDLAGNVTSDVSSGAWQVDTCVASDVTNPTDPTAVTNSGIGGSTTSPSLSWGASTDACGFSHYEVSIGTSAAATDVVTWTNIGNVLTHKFFGITPALVSNTNYFTNIRAVDLAGNNSNVVSTAAWQLPSPGGVSSAGLELWLDSDDASTVYQNNACSTAATTDGQSIGCWSDKSGNGRNATATGAATPAYRTNQFNAKPIIRFDGTDDALDFTALTNMRTVFVVRKSDENTWQPLFGHTTTTDWYTDNATLLGASASSNLTAGSWRADLSNVTDPDIYAQQQQYQLFSVVTTGNVSADHLASDRKTGGRFFDGDIAEVIVFSRALNSTEINDVENYLYSKWFSAIPAPITNLNMASAFTNISSQSPSFSFDHSISPNVNRYEVAIGTSEGGNEVSGWTSIGLSNSHQFFGLSLSECTDHYVSVRVVDTEGDISNVVSSPIVKYDGTAPTLPTGVSFSGTASATSSKTINWTSSTDACSFSHYEVSLGTTAGGNDAVDWENVGDVNSKFFSAIAPALTTATDYYLNVRAVDSAGNTSASVSTLAWQVDTCIATDTTNPSDPSSLVLSGDAQIDSSRSLSWSASTDGCAFSHYMVALGTSAGGTDIVGFTNIGNTLSHQFTSIAPYLAYNTNYYITVKGVDLAGNESNPISSSAFTVATPGSVSGAGLTLWMDMQDSSRLYQDDSCSSAVSSNGQFVGCVKDKSGNDNHATNSNNTNKPIYQSSSFIGRPSLYFDGSANEFLDFGTMNDIRTVFWVLKEDAANAGNTAFLLGDPNGATQDFARASTLGNIFDAGNASANVTGGDFQIDGAPFTPTTTVMPRSESVISLVTTGNVTASSFSRDRISCCSSRTWGGSLAEVIIFNRALSGAEVTSVNDYLKLKWGIVAGETVWLGATDTDWFDASNWSAGVPNSTMDCIIGDRANDPVISGGPASCKNATIGTGTLTLANGTSASLEVYRDLTFNGTLVPNDGSIVLRDDGSTATTQNLRGDGITYSNLEFNKTAGGRVNLFDTIIADNFDMGPTASFEFKVLGGADLTLTNGMTMASGTFNIAAGGDVFVGAGQTITINGGTFQTSGVSDALPQNLTNKGKIDSVSGRWGFIANAGTVNLTGFLLEDMDSNGLRIDGTANLAALDGGQWVNLNQEYGTPVRALNLNTSTSISETIPTNVGFNWGAANSAYAGTPDPTDNYLLVNAPNCGGATISFNLWFGNFFDGTGLVDTEDKIIDVDDSAGNTCQVSIDLANSPITLASFGATAYDTKVLLEWETSSELNHIGFNVYRSTEIDGNYVQINNELILNFLTSASFRGKYRFVDESLTNETLYYYKIEDVALDGTRDLHGPVYARPKSGLGAPPASDPDQNTVDDPPGVQDLGNGVSILAQTDSSIKLRVNPAALIVTGATWNGSYSHIDIPGYSRDVEAGKPELLNRVILIPIDGVYNGINSTQKTLTTSDATASLGGDQISPAPSWSADGSGVLQASYSPDAVTYTTNSFSPVSYYTVASSSVAINGKNYVKVTVNPVQYNPVTASLNRLDNLIIDISLDGTVWDYTPPVDYASVSPAAIEGNLRIRYSEEGIYKVTHTDLYNAYVEGPFDGEPVANFRLYYHGTEIPMEVYSPSGNFSTGDYIVFYGSFASSLEDGMDEVVLTPYDFDSVETNDPLRITDFDNQLSSSPYQLDSFTVTKKFEQANDLYVDDHPIGGMIDRYYWKQLFTMAGAAPNGASRLDFTAGLNNLWTSAPEDVVVTVELRGRPVMTTNPHHNIGLYVNGSDAGTVDFQVQTPTSISFNVPHSYFVDGNNTIRLEAKGDLIPAGEFDIIQINNVTIAYESQMKADSNQAHITQSNDEYEVYLRGFTENTFNVYDLSDPEGAVKYTNFFTETFDGGTTYEIGFDAVYGPLGTGGEKVHILTDSQFKSTNVFKLVESNQDNLKDTSNRADYLMIGSQKLLDAASDLKAHREGQSLEVMTVTLEDIYAQFSHGRVSSYGIKDFIAYALDNWELKPKYLLIIGDATLDPKDNLSFYTDDNGYMPIPFEHGQNADYGSDNWYVADDSGLPRLAVGRIPSNNQDAVYEYVQKVINYEVGGASPESRFAKQTTFISGVDQKGENFKGQAEKLSSFITAANSEYSGPGLHRSTVADDATMKSEIQNSFNEGPLMMTFIGHGNENGWETFFQNNEAKNLTNTKYPIVLALNCVNSYFYNADTSLVSLSEDLIFNKDGGAVAFWGSTTFTSPSVQMNLAVGLLDELGANTKNGYKVVRLGDLFMNAKIKQGIHTSSNDTIKSWTLIGDPALRLPQDSFTEVRASVNVPTPSVPVPSASGGGGCSLGASTGNDSRSPWSGMLEWIFLFASLYAIRKTTKLLARK